MLQPAALVTGQSVHALTFDEVLGKKIKYELGRGIF
jgi:hypothetical protein